MLDGSKSSIEISIHALLAESDDDCGGVHGLDVDFYPRSPCGERLPGFQPRRLPHRISIHALLAESDVFLLKKITITVDISIHALLAESDEKYPVMLLINHYFYPRSPCGERRWLRCWQLAARDISIHALLAESDVGQKRLRQKLAISIHALLAESDAYEAEKKATGENNFYPRSPCGERPAVEDKLVAAIVISIHALLAESDHQYVSSYFWRGYFYPRSPCGERLNINRPTITIVQFLSTLSLRRATERLAVILANTQHFYPRSPCGERLLSDYQL